MFLKVRNNALRVSVGRHASGVVLKIGPLTVSAWITRARRPGFLVDKSADLKLFGFHARRTVSYQVTR